MKKAHKTILDKLDFASRLAILQVDFSLKAKNISDIFVCKIFYYVCAFIYII